MSTAHMPAGAGPAAPENDKARGQAGFVRDQEATGNGADSAQAGHAAQLAEALRRKAEATLIARAALAGVELVRLADGSWIVSRWGLVRPLANDADVEAWLQRVGAPG